jgi:hypothetical protein
MTTWMDIISTGPSVVESVEMRVGNYDWNALTAELSIPDTPS